MKYYMLMREGRPVYRVTFKTRCFLVEYCEHPQDALHLTYWQARRLRRAISPFSNMAIIPHPWATALRHSESPLQAYDSFFTCNITHEEKA